MRRLLTLAVALCCLAAQYGLGSISGAYDLGSTGAGGFRDLRFATGVGRDPTALGQEVRVALDRLREDGPSATARPTRMVAAEVRLTRESGSSTTTLACFGGIRDRSGTVWSADGDPCLEASRKDRFRDGQETSVTFTFEVPQDAGAEYELLMKVKVGNR